MSDPLPMQLPSRRRRPVLPTAPRHLSPTSRAWWREMIAAYAFDPAALRILEGAATTWDRALSARESIASEGAVIHDRFGSPRTHPAVAIEKNALIAFARLMRELAIDPSPPDSRPPSRYHR